jgi:hypothetical protein
MREPWLSAANFPFPASNHKRQDNSTNETAALKFTVHMRAKTQKAALQKQDMYVQVKARIACDDACR